MPKSKRNKVVSLTVTKKKGKELKSKLIEDVRGFVDAYKNVFVLSYDHMRTDKMQEIREHWKESGKFSFGKNKVIKVALGMTEEEEIADGIRNIGNVLSGSKGLLFTNETEKEVLKYFNSFSHPTFAKTGDIATETIVLDKGPLKDFPFALESRLRSLGLYTRLKNGIIELEKDHVVCEEGKELTKESAQLLELMGIEMAEMKFNVNCQWNKKSGFKDYTEKEDSTIKKKVQKKVTKKSKQVAKKTKKVQKKADVEMEEEEEEAEEELELN